MVSDSRALCVAFKKGTCEFGEKCFFRHDAPSQFIGKPVVAVAKEREVKLFTKDLLVEETHRSNSWCCARAGNVVNPLEDSRPLSPPEKKYLEEMGNPKEETKMNSDKKLQSYRSRTRELGFVF